MGYLPEISNETKYSLSWCKNKSDQDMAIGHDNKENNIFSPRGHFSV